MPSSMTLIEATEIAGLDEVVQDASRAHLVAGQCGQSCSVAFSHDVNWLGTGA